MTIPVENIYYLLCYAWDQWVDRGLADLEGMEGPRVQDLLAVVLARGTARLLRQGLDRQYVEHEEVMAGIRGKLDVSGSIKAMVLPYGRALCQFDALDHDVLHNRILAATLDALLRVDLSPKAHEEVKAVRTRFPEVRPLQVQRAHFGRIQLHGNTRAYRLLLEVCRLIHENLIPGEAPGRLKFLDFAQDEAQMWRIFESFVFHFYRREQSAYAVSRPKVPWQDPQGSKAALGLLPTMQTDVVLTGPDRRLVIDCKYYKDTLQGHHGAAKLKNENLYQLLTYVHNLAADAPSGPPVEGMLLYPVVKTRFVHDLRVMGRQIRVATVDLGQPWEGVAGELLGLVG